MEKISNFETQNWFIVIVMKMVTRLETYLHIETAQYVLCFVIAIWVFVFNELLLKPIHRISDINVNFSYIFIILLHKHRPRPNWCVVIDAIL